MTEHNHEFNPDHEPDHANDDTRRIPSESASTPPEPPYAPRYEAPTGSTHRYQDSGGAESPYTASHSSYAGQQSPYPGSSQREHIGGFGFDRQERERRNRPGGAVIAGILAAALVVGGISGLVGAAGFTAADHLVGDDTASSSSQPNTSSAVVNRKDVAPSANSVEAVAASVLPSVVKINVQGAQAEGSGSGIVISSDGEILTNNHVVAVAGQDGQMSVSFNDGSARRATVVHTDPVTDLAVIKAQGVSGLHPASIAKNNVAVGENVVAIGSPFGLEATVTSGIVSALNRPVSVGGEGSSGQSSQDTTYPAIQTDAAINPGNSGGPLVDLNGDVVGINSSIRTASSGGLDSSEGGSIGLGFAIPINKVWPIVQQLREGKTPTHARMGVSVTDAGSNNGLLSGAGISQVNPGSAAAKAGLKRGEVITKVDDDIITGSESLVATIRGHRPGDTVTLTVVTGGDNTRRVQVTLDSDKGSASS
jgi:putative serine protease PepD